MWHIKLLNRINFNANNNLVFTKDLSILNPKNYDFIVLDSKDYLEVDIERFIDLMKKHPRQSFIVLSQATKGGNFSDSERWRNTVDVMVQAENGTVRTGHDKNRMIQTTLWIVHGHIFGLTTFAATGLAIHFYFLPTFIIDLQHL